MDEDIYKKILFFFLDFASQIKAFPTCKAILATIMEYFVQGGAAVSNLSSLSAREIEGN
jgi:hypothetical protein